MNIEKNVSILDGLQVCRDKIEAKHYLKAHGICMNEHELDALKNHCYTENAESTLTKKQLNNVAGGNPPLAIVHEPAREANRVVKKKKNPYDLGANSLILDEFLKEKNIPLEREFRSGRGVRRTSSGSTLMKEAVAELEQKAAELRQIFEKGKAEMQQKLEEGKAELHQEFEEGIAEMHQEKEKFQREIREKM